MERISVPFTGGPAAGRELPVEWRTDFWPVTTTTAVAAHDGHLVQLYDVTAYVAARLIWHLYARERTSSPPGWRMTATGIDLTPGDPNAPLPAAR